MRKLSRPTDHRMSVIQNLATNLLWNGRIETTLAKAKEVRSYAEKILTLAINTYEDTVKVVKEVVGPKGEKVKTEVFNDGAKKLAARRKLMANLYDKQEEKGQKETKSAYKARTAQIQHPLIERLFDDLAPKYAKRAEELGTKGGYTRVIKTSLRRGDNAQKAIVELV